MATSKTQTGKTKTTTGSKSTSAKSTSKSSAPSAKAKAGSSAKAGVTQSKAAMERFKSEVASELGVNLKAGYNGDLTAKQAGQIGGEMVRRMIKKQASQMK